MIDDVHVPNEIYTSGRGGREDFSFARRTFCTAFTLPNLRLKQDTLPGKTIPMWFQANKHNCRFVVRKVGEKEIGEMVQLGGSRDAWEIACQELCGGRHYAMRGRLYVHEDKKSFDAWFKHRQQQQNAHSLDAVAALRD